MDFNTRGERPEDRPLFGGEAGGRTGGPGRGPAGGPGGEFNLSDPINSFIGTVRTLVLNPVGFFQGIARRGDFVNPLVFAVICGVINGILGGIIGFLAFLLMGPRNQEVGGAFAGIIGNIILAPIGTVIALLIGAAIFHLLVMLLVRPANAGFEATFRVVSYSMVYQLVSWIPVIGILASIWGLILAILGVREVHTTTTGRAMAVVLIPAAVLLLLLLFLVAVVGAALFFGSQQQF